jgi:hypothetical protein
LRKDCSHAVSNHASAKHQGQVSNTLGEERRTPSSNSPNGVGDEDSSGVEDVVADGKGAVAQLVGIVESACGDGANKERSGQSNIAIARGDANQSLLKGL